MKKSNSAFITSYERDNETDLDYAKARMYGNSYGRFTSPDPLLTSGRIENPQTWNRYIYALNNPLLYIDPFGLYEWASSAGGQATDEELLARSKDKSLKKSERKLAEKQYNFRQQFKAGLEAAKAAANDPRLTPQQRAEAQRAVNSYGEWKKEDDVSVGIVAKKGDAPNVAFGESDGKIHVDLNLNLSNRNPIITIAHEGSHIADFQELASARGTPNESNKDVDAYTTERRAYFVSSYMAQALNVSPYYPEESKDRQIWNKGWKENVREVKRANGVTNYTPWSETNRGPKISTQKNTRY
jgi:RHS repeat-associated protein